MGKAMARGFAEAGANVVISSRHEAELKSAAAEIAEGTKGKVEDRSWRMKLTMAKVDDRWLISKLEFVG